MSEWKMLCGLLAVICISMATLSTVEHGDVTAWGVVFSKRGVFTVTAITASFGLLLLGTLIGLVVYPLLEPRAQQKG
jgi:hypothetical protein